MFSFIWQKKPPYSLCKWHRLLSFLEFRHEKVIGTPLYHRKNCIAVTVNDKVHSPVAKTFSVCFYRTLMYAYTVFYAGRLSLPHFRVSSVVCHLMPAVPDQFPTFIGMYHLIDDFMEDTNALFLFEPI